MGSSAEMTIERTFDTELVRSILSNSRLKLRIGAPVEAFDPSSQKDIYYLSCVNGNDVLGLVVFHPFNTIDCCQGHVNYLPKYWGSALHEYTKLAIKWLFDNTHFIKIVALIPDYYPLVLKHALASGMQKEGYLQNSVISNGKPDNMTLLGVDRWSV